MNNELTITALLLFAAWIIVSFGLAQRRLNNLYMKFPKGNEK